MRSTNLSLLGALAALILSTNVGAAQSRVGADSATRLTRLGRAFVRGTVEGFAYAGIDQARSDPEEWGKGWPGYERRLGSNLGEFYIQEGVTEGLAALMNRPLDYTRCRCREFDERFVNAVRGAVTDQLPNGTHVLAVPRIAGAYIGSFAQASWRPNTSQGRTRTALVNGTTSLAFGALINLYHEIRR